MNSRALTIAAVAAVGVASLASGSAAARTGAAAASLSSHVWGTAEEVPGTAALNRGGSAQITSVSCGSAGNCSAGGSYQDSSGHFQAFVASQASGTWHTAIEVPGTAALNRGGFAQINSVSCGAAGGTDAGLTYPVEAITRLVAAAHQAGAQVAVHSTVPGAGQLVAAGVDSVEHGFGLDQDVVKDMVRRGTAQTPKIGALLALRDAAGITPQHRRRFQDGYARIAELVPLAVRFGVPVLAGTDVSGSIPEEVALLAQIRLEPQDALAAASTWPRRFLGAPATADIVTYHHDPRHDPGQLAHPAAVVANGVRLQ